LGVIQSVWFDYRKTYFPIAKVIADEMLNQETLTSGGAEMSLPSSHFMLYYMLPLN